MTINVNQSVMPVKAAAGATDTSLSLNDILRLKKKKSRHLDQLETLVPPLLPQYAPQLDAAISLELRPMANTVRESPQTSRPPTQFAHRVTSSIMQPHFLIAGASLARDQPTTKSNTSRAALISAEARMAAPSSHNITPTTKSNTSRAALISAEARMAAPSSHNITVAMTPHQSVLSAKLEPAGGALAHRYKLTRTAEEGMAQAGAITQAALLSSDSAPIVAAEDAWFTSQATPVNLPKEQAENAGGMKLSYQFLRWGGGQVDISAQPRQLLFQPSTEMVRERLGESLLASPQAKEWQMDEQPDRRQSQQHPQNDEEES